MNKPPFDVEAAVREREERYCEKTKNLDRFYALLAGLGIGVLVGLAVGYRCGDWFLGHCTDVYFEPVWVVVAGIISGVFAFCATLPKVRAWRRRKSYFG